MKVAVSVRVRNGYLVEAAKQCDSQAALAEWLGVPAQFLSDWINYRRPFWSASKHFDADFVAAKLETICDAPIEEIFPDEVYGNKEWLKKKKMSERIAEMPIEQLIATGAIPALPPSPDAVVLKRELREQMDDILKTITPRQEKILRRRFGLDGDSPATLEEIGQDFGVSRDRIRQIEAQALRHLRHHSRSRKLLPFLDATNKQDK